MDSTQEGDPLVYVTLVEAAADIGGSPEDLRKAVRQQQIKGIKENPENKHSRWLVALEDVRSLYRTEPDGLSDGSPESADQDESPTVAKDQTTPDDTKSGPEAIATETRQSEQPSAVKDGATLSDAEADPGTATDGTPEPEEPPATDTEPEPNPETVAADTPEPEVPSVAADEVISDSTPMEVVPDIVDSQVRHLPSNQPNGVTPSMAEAVLGRGEELIGRLTEAIDRFSDNVPQAPFDYQALLDKYVAAVEKAADAEVRAATLQRRIDDLSDQTADSSERLEQAQAQNRQLLAELEIARAEIDVAADRGSVDDGRPLWKRRNRQ